MAICIHNKHYLISIFNYYNLSLSLPFVRAEDENDYTEPDESIFDEDINVEEDNNTRENSYLDVHDGYDE